MSPTSGSAGRRERQLLALLTTHRRDPLGHLLRCAREDGDLVVFRLGPMRVVVLNEPTLIQEILVKRNAEFRKGHFLQAKSVPWARAILGSGLLMSDGQTWLRQRRLMQPAFHRERAVAYGASMVECAEGMVERWEKGVQRDMYDDMRRLTLDVMARTIFGVVDHGDELYAALAGVFAHRHAGGLSGLAPEWVPTPGNVRTRVALRRLDALIYGAIRERRERPAARPDLLSLLLEARDEDGSAMTDRQVRDEIMSTMVAGHDTLGSTLTWTLHALASRPMLAERLGREVTFTLSGRPPVSADIAQLPLLRNIAQEALRLYPPGKSIVRSVVTPCEIAGYPVPAGSYVVMSQWIVHRDPRYYERPEEFDADRWSGGLAERLPRFAFFPFGGGPRLCLGQAFAEQMLRLVLAVVSQRTRLALPADPRLAEWDPATLRPRRGLWLTPASLQVSR